MKKALELHEIPHGSAIAVYGHGELGTRVVRLLATERPDVTVRCFLDSFSSNASGEIPCLKFSTAPPAVFAGLDLIVIASAFRYEILSHILEQKPSGQKVPVRFVHPEFPFGHDAADYSNRLLTAWKKRGSIPNVLAVTFSSACNFRCSMCMAAKRGMLKEHFLSREVFDRVIEEYHKAGLMKIGLNGHGESLLHPEFFSMVRQAHEAGLAMSVITNGSRLDEDSILELSAMNVHIAVSFCGWDKESYERQYRGGSFEHTVSLIRFMAENLEPSAFTIKACVLDPDPEQVARVEEFFASLGLDIVSCRIAEASSQGGTFSYGSYCSSKDIYGFKPGLERKEQPLCKRLLNSWMVLPDGRITACGCGPAIQEFIIGDIRTQSLEEMGQSPLLQKIIDSFLDPKRKALGACARCDKPYHPSFMQPMTEVAY